MAGILFVLLTDTSQAPRVMSVLQKTHEAGVLGHILWAISDFSSTVPKVLIYLGSKYQPQAYL